MLEEYGRVQGVSRLKQHGPCCRLRPLKVVPSLNAISDCTPYSPLRNPRPLIAPHFCSFFLIVSHFSLYPWQFSDTGAQEGCRSLGGLASLMLPLLDVYSQPVLNVRIRSESTLYLCLTSSRYSSPFSSFMPPFSISIVKLGAYLGH